MTNYFFDLVGIDSDDTGFAYPTLLDARNAAVSYLAEYLKDDPNYASRGHWQVDVYDHQRTLLLNVVVAVVDAKAMANINRNYSA